MISERLATPVDLRTTWTLPDVYDAIEALNVQRENERRALDEAKRKSKPTR